MSDPDSESIGSQDEDLATRVDELERVVEEQSNALGELRAEVQRLRSVLSSAEESASGDGPETMDTEDSEALDPELPEAPPESDEIDAPEPEVADSAEEEPEAPPSTRPASSADASPEESDTTSPPADQTDDPVSPPSDRPEAAPPHSDSDEPTIPSESPASPTSTGSKRGKATSDSEAVLDRLASWAGLRSEDWLNYVGIGLFLFGILFLLRYSIEQGWLVPAVRVGFGAVLGATLLGTGLRLSRTRERLRQVLLGGSSGTFYATVFAAYQFYGLLSYPTAFTFMGIVTVGTVALAVRQNEPVLSIIGILGGLGTPFLLYNQAGSLAGFSLYTCTVLLGACAVFVMRGWQSLLFTTVGGGWLVFFVSVVRAIGAEPTPPDLWALQTGVGVAWLLLAGTPVLQAFLHDRAPNRWPTVSLPKWLQPLASTTRASYSLVTISPFFAFTSTRLLWSASDTTWALVAGVGALIYGGAYVGLRRVSLSNYAPVHALVAAVLAAYGLSKVLGGAALLVAWSVEAALLLNLANRLGETTFRISGHVLFVITAARLAPRLLDVAPDATPIVRPEALSELVALGLVGAAAQFVRVRWHRWTYRGAALAGWLTWVTGELWFATHGPHYVLLLWTGTGTALAAVAPRIRDDAPLRTATHIVFAGIGILLLSLTIQALNASAAVLPALLRLAVVGLWLWASRYVEPSGPRTMYRSAGLAGWLVWLPSVLLSLSHGGSYTLVAWALTAAGLLVAAPALEEDTSTIWRAVHLIYVFLGVSLAIRLLDPRSASLPILNVAALSELIVLGLALAASRRIEQSALRHLYRGAVLVGWLAWTAGEMALLSNGQAYTSLVWGATAAALLVSGARYARRPWQIAGLATLVIFVAKLFLVDLASLPPLWRIALFLGSGAAFLGVSYLLPDLVPSSGGEADEQPEENPA